MHYPSDVLAGYGVTLAGLALYAARVLSRRKDMADLLVGVAGDFVPAREVLRGVEFAENPYVVAEGAEPVPGTLDIGQRLYDKFGHVRLGGISSLIAETIGEDATRLRADPGLGFVCGPTRLVETVASTLVGLGHDPARIKTERFGGA